jgi:aspartate/methionine/tyrosine aminotransferase
MLKPASALLGAQETTIFTTMSALAVAHGAINLGQGFPDTEGPREIVEAAQRFLADGRNQYAPLTGVPELRAAVAAVNARFYGLEIDPDAEVVVTSGATEAIFASLAAVVDPGDEVVLIEPLYDTYLPAVRMLGAVPRIVRLQPPDWRLPLDELARAFGPKTKAILLNTPGNPTGRVFTAVELDAIASLVIGHGAYAVCDEVYEHLVFEGARHVPLMTRPGMRERTIRIGSAGKTFSLTGWKIGYATAPAPLALLVARAHQTVVFASAPNLQRAVAVGLGLDDAYFAGLAKGLQGKRDLLAGGLRSLGFKVLPSEGSYFLTVDLRSAGIEADDLAFCRWLVREAGVAAIPVSAFYAADPPRHLVRFAFPKRDAVLREAVERIGAAFAARGGVGRAIDAPAVIA